jgi:predicted transcriptional regulator
MRKSNPACSFPVSDPSSAEIDIDEAKRRAVIEGRADIRAGRFADQNEVLRWLESWGMDDERAPPECG